MNISGHEDYSWEGGEFSRGFRSPLFLCCGLVQAAMGPACPSACFCEKGLRVLEPKPICGLSLGGWGAGGGSECGDGVEGWWDSRRGPRRLRAKESRLEQEVDVAEEGVAGGRWIFIMGHSGVRLGARGAWKTWARGKCPHPKKAAAWAGGQALARSLQVYPAT